MAAVKVANIYVTTDYSIFKQLPGNREVSTDRKNKILKSIEKNGAIFDPISVNEKMQVIDGQGRLAALKERGLPVYYYIAQGMTARECAVLNSASTNWKLSDYIKSYADLGNENYMRLRLLIERHPTLRERDVVGIASTPPSFGTGNNHKMVRGGHIVISAEKYQWSDVVCSRYEPCYSLLKKVNCDIYWVGPAVLYAITQEDVDRKRLYSIIERSKSIKTNGDLKSALETISEIYNYRLKSGQIDLQERYWKLKHDNGIESSTPRHTREIRRELENDVI